MCDLCYKVVNVCYVFVAGPRVAVLREEGSNGDREMAASLFMVGFETWDVTMQDLIDKKVTVDQFQGIIFPGGFSYAGNQIYCVALCVNFHYFLSTLHQAVEFPVAYKYLILF